MGGGEFRHQTLGLGNASNLVPEGTDHSLKACVSKMVFKHIFFLKKGPTKSKSIVCTFSSTFSLTAYNINSYSI